MSFENLNIGRIIIHEVFKRNDDRTLREPRYSNQLIQLDIEARDALQQRITNALGQSSHGVEMTIHDTGDESAWRHGKSIIDSGGNDEEFIRLSQVITAKLAAAQTNRIVPGGIVVVIDGTTGYPARSFMGVIKAEPHGGFTRREDSGRLLLQYLKDLILTPQAKLYKIGAFLWHEPSSTTRQQPTGGWRAFLFDDLITHGDKLGAAQYFYETFLGLSFPENSAFQTKQFHSLTKDFIRAANIEEEKKSDLLNALTTYLKTDQTATIQVSVFSDNYLDMPELRDDYARYMTQKNFPQHAIHKDLSEVASALKQRKLVFSHNIKLTAPAEQFEEMVRIRSINGEADANGITPKWTQITVRDHIRDQE